MSWSQMFFRHLSPDNVFSVEEQDEGLERLLGAASYDHVCNEYDRCVPGAALQRLERKESYARAIEAKERAFQKWVFTHPITRAPAAFSPKPKVYAKYTDGKPGPAGLAILLGLGLDIDMSNFPTIVDPADLATQLDNSQVTETTGHTGVSFLKMDFETGTWLLGQDAEDVTDEEILVNTASIQHGWILWSGGRPQKSFAGFSQTLPMAPEPIGEDYPSEARSFQGALCDDGAMLAFDTNSFGGRKGCDILLGKIKAQSAAGHHHLYPKVKLTSESYANAKRGGKLTFNPVFEIVSWCDQDGNEEGEAPEQIEAGTTGTEPPAEKPKKRQRRKHNAAV